MNRAVNIGGPIALFILGAVLYFALKVDTPGVDASMVGLIAMIGGGLWLVVGVIMGSQKRKATTTARDVTHDPSAPGGQRVNESEVATEDTL